jgi:hypothetical protein
MSIADELRGLGYSPEIARSIAALIEEAERSGQGASMEIPEWAGLNDQRRRDLSAWLGGRGYRLDGAGPDVVIMKL